MELVVLSRLERLPAHWARDLLCLATARRLRSLPHPEVLRLPDVLEICWMEWACVGVHRDLVAVEDVEHVVLCIRIHVHGKAE